MARADIWLRKKTRRGKQVPDSWYYKTVRLRTQDANVAKQRARLALAGQWPPPEEAAAKTSANAFALQAEPAAPSPVPPESGVAAPSRFESAPVESEENQSAAGPPPSSDGQDWTTAAAAAGADAGAPPPLKPDVVNPEAEKEKRETENAQLARVIVEGQLWATTMFVKAKVWKGFSPPELDDGAKGMLAAPYATMLNYGGLSIVLPPWMTGLVIPGVTAIVGAVAMARAFADVAREQKAAAEGAARAAA